MGDENSKGNLIAIAFGTREVFRVTDYEFELKVHKFKMADPTWRTEMEKKLSRWS